MKALLRSVQFLKLHVMKVIKDIDLIADIATWNILLGIYSFAYMDIT